MLAKMLLLKKLNPLSGLLASLCITTLLFSCQQGGSSAEPATPAGNLVPPGNASFAISGPVITDCNFNNSTISSGDTVTAYQNSSVSFGGTCISETRTCRDGFLSGSYSYGSCAISTPASCLFNGQTLQHGSSVDAFIASSVGLGDECISEVRTCNNGVLSGVNQYASCTINLSASCLFNGQTVPGGTPVNAYLNSSVPYGELCSVEARYCVDGALSGTHQYASCTVGEPASCLFNGQTIANGQTVTAFLNSTVGFGESCQDEIRTCNNGVLSGVNQYAGCAIDQPRSCLFNGQTVPHGASASAYLASTTAFGELCDAEERFCNNGHLDGSYQYGSCAMDQPASCLFNGETVAHAAYVTAFETSSVGFGKLCVPEKRQCLNGALTGTAAFASCSIGSPASCLFNDQTVAHNQTILGYLSSSVAAGSICQSEIKTCTNGELSGLFTFSSCTVEVVVPNPGDGSGDDKDDNDDKDKYCKKQRIKKDQHDDDDHKDKRDKRDEKDRDDKQSHSDNGLHLGWYKHKHKEHYDCGKHLGWYKEKKEKKNSCEIVNNNREKEKKEKKKN